VRLTALIAVPLLLVSCSSGSKGTGTLSTTGSPDAQTVTVEMRNDLKNYPTTVKARVGTVTFDVRNVETVPHDLVFDDKGLGKTRTVDGKSDERLKVTFDKAGTFRFTCTFHPGMDGEVVVS
jgi:plastocyanin